MYPKSEAWTCVTRNTYLVHRSMPRVRSPRAATGCCGKNLSSRCSREFENSKPFVGKGGSKPTYWKPLFSLCLSSSATAMQGSQCSSCSVYNVWYLSISYQGFACGVLVVVMMMAMQAICLRTGFVCLLYPGYIKGEATTPSDRSHWPNEPLPLACASCRRCGCIQHDTCLTR